MQNFISRLKPWNQLDYIHRIVLMLIMFCTVVIVFVLPLSIVIHYTSHVHAKNTIKTEAVLDIQHPHFKQIENKNYSTANQRSQFINQVGTMAVKNFRHHQNYQVLPSVIIAQAIVESFWGQSTLSEKANNYFGVKYNGTGSSINLPTTEYVHGQKITENAEFQRYPSLLADVHNQSEILHKLFIKQNHVMNYKVEAWLLQHNKYATDPNYAVNLIRVIQMYNLQRFDLKGLQK